jgi:cysteine desulfuration protein SufE
MTDIDDIVDSFDFLGDWDARYQYLVDLGEALPAFDDSLRTEENRVQGCISKVWVYANPDSEEHGRLSYTGDCDTTIIKGVLALLIGLMSGRTPAQIVQLDVDELFERLQLAEHLSPNRHFGIYGIVELMKTQARRFLTGDESSADARQSAHG